jgi:NodT family efflux transporter outer membrane factor (OMF) lipoprotein
MNLHLKYLLFTVLLSLGLVACKIPSIQNETIQKNIPTSFNSFETDSTFKVVNWKLFFADQNLQNLIDEAFKNSQDYNIMLQKLQIASQQWKQNKLIQLPSLDFVLGAGRRKYGFYTVDGIGNYDTKFSPNLKPEEIIPEHIPDYQAGLQANWEIDLWGKLNQLKKSAKFRFLQSQEGLNFYKTILTSEIAASYYELVALDKELEIVRNNILLQAKAYEMVQLQKQSGMANELAVKQIHAQLLNTQSLELDLKMRIQKEENYLNALLGRYPQQISRGNDLEQKFYGDSLRFSSPQSLLLGRPDVKQSEYALRASKADLKAARAAFLPSLGIQANFGQNSFKFSTLLDIPTSLTYNVAAGLVAPIFNRNTIKTNFNIRKAEQIEATLNYQKTIIQAYSEVLGHTFGAFYLNQIEVFKEQQVAELVAGVEIASQLFATGNANYLEVISVQESALSKELELILIKKQRILENILLYKSLGGGW